jgi:transglutaminase-like putative cysteine protease
MSRHTHRTIPVVVTSVLLLAWSAMGLAAGEGVLTGGLHRDEALVDSFVEPLPPSVLPSRSLARPSGAESMDARGTSRASLATPGLDTAAPSLRSQSSPLTGVAAQDGTRGAGPAGLSSLVQPSRPSAETRARNQAFQALAEVGAQIQELLQQMQSQQGASLVESHQKLGLFVERLTAATPTARRALAGTGDRLVALKLDAAIRARHRESLKAFDRGSERLRAALADVVAGKQGALDAAVALMRELKFRNPSPLLNAGLPFERRVVEAPTLTREQADAAPADAALAAPAAIPQALALPAPADLAPTPDVQLTPAIRAKAAELGNSPQAIYEFVRNRVAFQPYLGSRKGAAQTLAQLRGNDTDQASLLIALLRAAGIPSRYVRGTVEMTPHAVQTWLGVDDAATAASILTTAGLDGLAIVTGPEVVAIRSTHVWVEAYVPYTNYRGIPNDATGATWVPLAPSFKASTVTPGEDVLAAMGFDIDAFIAGYISTFIEPSPLEKLALDIQAHLDATDPGKTVADIERRRVVAGQLLGLLPSTPPYQVLSVTHRLSELEDAKRYKVRFHLYNGGVNLIDHTVRLIDLAGRRLTIEYIGATPADQATIDSFGGIYETPPSLVNVKPVLEIDGVAVAAATNAIGMGRTHNSDMQFIQAAGASNAQPLVQNEIIAGNGQAIAFDTFLDVNDAFFASEAFPPEDFLEAILHAAAVEYLSKVDRGLERAERLMGVVTTQDVSEAIVENAIAVSYSFGVPVTFEWTGLTVDADRRIIGTFDVDGDGSRDIPYMKLTGADGSVMENRIFEDMFAQQAVSTIKILALASDAGIVICTIQTSVYNDCPGISHPSNIISALNAALAQGHVITIPKAPITVGLWLGTGYIDRNPATGAGGYIISGGISGNVQTSSGGATVDRWPVALPCEANSVTGDVLVPGADAPDPSAVFCADDTPLLFNVEFTSQCKSGSAQTHQQTFTTSKTKEQIGAGNYTLQLQAFGSSTIIRNIAIIQVEEKCKTCEDGQVVADDQNKPDEQCKDCAGGEEVDVPDGSESRDTKSCCFEGGEIQKYNVPYAALTTKCPARRQVAETVRQHEIDGCSNSPDNLESWDNLPFAQNYDKYVTNPIWGTVLGTVSNAVAAAQTLPCNVHDICYQTCRSNKAGCDATLGAGITATCDIGYPFPCPHATVEECNEYTSEYQDCRGIGPIYQAGVGAGGGGAYETRQSQFCGCCTE